MVYLSFNKIIDKYIDTRIILIRKNLLLFRNIFKCFVDVNQESVFQTILIKNYLQEICLFDRWADFIEEKQFIKLFVTKS